MTRLQKTKRAKAARSILTVVALAMIIIAALACHNFAGDVYKQLETISGKIESLDTRQTELESTMTELNTVLEEQKQINTKITELLETQNQINSTNTEDPLYKQSSIITPVTTGTLDQAQSRITLASRGGIGLEERDTIEVRLNKINMAQNETIEEQQRRLYDFSSFYTNDNVNSDLCRYVNISEEEMNIWIADIAPSSSPFVGRADVFLSAAAETGLNPKYIFAHAAEESGYGTSGFARNRGNYFGINAVDSNPNNAFHMGDTLETGIMEGAIWIKQKYYDKGRTTLAKMKAAGYASNPDWEGNILSIMNH